MADVPNTFVESVVLSGDGTTALIGTPDYAPNSNDGAAYIFRDSAAGWQREALLRNPAPQPYQADAQKQWYDTAFGHSVALSSDGNTALVSAPFDAPQGPTTPTGSAVVYARAADGTWSQQGAKLTGVTSSPFVAGTQSGPPFTNHLGWSVALSGDGNTALIGSVSGSYGGNGSLTVSSAPVIYTRTGTTWEQRLEPALQSTPQASIPITDPLSDANWPREVALSVDARTIAYGAHDQSAGAGSIVMFAYGEVSTPSSPSSGSNSSTGAHGVVNCIVPHIVGKTVSAARVALRAAHCSLGRIRYVKARTKAGRVVAQSRRPQAKLPPGSNVAVNVARR